MDKARPDRTAPFHMFSGEPVWIHEPSRTNIRPSDIRRHAARLSRFTGGTGTTVLQHSALCVALAIWRDEGPAVIRALACHDLPEVILGEVPVGSKTEPFRVRERAWETRFFAALGVEMSADTHKAVKAVDRMSASIEMWITGHGARVLRERPSWIPMLLGAVLLTRWPGAETLCWALLCLHAPALRRAVL